MKKMMSWKLLLLGSLGLALITGFVHSQSKNQKMLDKKIEDFQVNEAPTSLVLQRLASNSAVPIGIEAVPESDGKVPTMDVNLKDATVRSILDYIVEKDAHYNWLEAGAVVNVFPKKGKDPLLETIVERYEANNLNKEEAIRALESSVEVKQNLRKGSLRNRTLKSLPGDGEEGLHRFSLNLKSTSVRNILNAIMLGSKSNNWLFFRYGPRKQFYSITLR